tara:strand:- start:1212 stop:1811 length:600 start_codon:yes stop_codon:yes gene_type:complete
MVNKISSSTLFLVLALVFFSLMAFTTVNKGKKEVTKVNILKPVELSKALTIDTIEAIAIEIKDHAAFLNDIGHQESRNRYGIVNRYGYMGRYQFGKSTLKTIKIKVSRREFLKDTLLQEEAMHRLLMYNKRKLELYIQKYSGEIVHGITVTESGLLAAAHLGGAGSVKKWFRSGRVRKDGNGVRITTYMRKFGGYTLNL